MLEQRDAEDRTPLISAAMGNRAPAVKTLLRAGAIVDARGGSDGKTTALLAAVAGGHPEAARALVVAGASAALANEKGEDDFELAVEVICAKSYQHGRIVCIFV